MNRSQTCCDRPAGSVRRGPCFLATALWLIVLLSGCSGSDRWQLKSLEGLMPELAFTLTDESGKTVHGSDFRGKVVMMYFGYTHCPDICPTTLATLSRVIRGLDSRSDEVRVLFVTVDPRRDSVKRLRKYTAAFGPQFVGLRGNEAQLRALTKRYRVTYGYDEPDDDGNYAVSHSSAIFIFDRRGKARLLGRRSDDVAAIHHDLDKLVSE